MKKTVGAHVRGFCHIQVFYSVSRTRSGMSAGSSPGDLASSGADVWRVTVVRAPPSALVPARPEGQPKSNF